jgi:hypothetical protein
LLSLAVESALAWSLASFFSNNMDTRCANICSSFVWIHWNRSTQCNQIWHQLSRVWATVDGVWINNWFYWTIIARKYKLLVYTLSIHCGRPQIFLVCRVFISPLVPASIYERPRAQPQQLSQKDSL